MAKPKVYFFSTQDNGCGKYRMWQPAASLERQGLIEMRREPDAPGSLNVERCDEIFKWADVVVCQPFTEPMMSCIFLAARDTHKKKLVVDLDDDVWSVHPMNVGTVDGKLAYIQGVFTGEWDDFWELVPIEQADISKYANYTDGTIIKDQRNGKLALIKQKRPDAKIAAEFLINGANGCTTTNQHLADKITRETSVVATAVLPNCLDLQEWSKSQRKPNKDEIWLGWCGSVSHYPDLRDAAEVIDKLMKRYPQLRLQIMGSSFDYFYPVKKGADRQSVAGYHGGDEPLFAARFEDSQERWPGKMSFHKPVAIQKYVEWVKDEWRADIGLAPLEDNDFNKAKSELKWLEYSALGAVTVASKIGPYTRAIEHDKNGKLCGSNGSWYKGLEELIESPEKRDELAAAAKQTLYDKYDQDKQAHKWLEAYESF